MIRTDTKKILADSLTKLLKKHPLDEITVEDICAGCSCSRTTFYRYFKDKYELTNWIYTDRFQKIVGAHPGPDNWEEVIRETLIFLHDNQELFRKIIRYKGQNSFEKYAEELMLTYYHEKVVGKKLGAAEEFALNVFVRGLLRAGSEWLEDQDSTGDIESLVKYGENSIPVALLPYLKIGNTDT